MPNQHLVKSRGFALHHNHTTITCLFLRHFSLCFLFHTKSEATKPPIQWVPGAHSPVKKWPERGADHSSPTSANAKNSSSGRDLNQVTSRGPITAETRVGAWANLRWICGGQNGTGIGLSPSSSVAPYHYHSTMAVDTYISWRNGK
jgi:hypothetical protein